MTSPGGLKGRLNRFVSTPDEAGGRLARLARRQVRFWWHCFRQLRENNAMAMSAALSFRTIFALVPTLVLALLVLKSFGAFQSREVLDRFLDQAGFSQIVIVGEGDRAGRKEAPEGAEEGPDGPRPGRARASSRPREVTLADRLEKIVARTEQKLTLGRIGPVGALLVVWAAVALLITIERSLNRIFRAARSRSLARRVLLYWSAVTFVPTVIVAADYGAARVARAFSQMAGVSWLMVSIGWVGPILVGILLLAAVYTVMPNTRVRFRWALVGALVGVPLWLLAKWGFATYVNVIIKNRSIYGALGLIPLFLIWLNVSWVIFLFGAQLAHSAASVRHLAAAGVTEPVSGAWDLLAVALAVAEEYQTGRGPVSVKRLTERLALDERVVRTLLGRLCEADIACRVGEAASERYVLAQPADKVSVTALLAQAPSRTGRDDSVFRAVAEARRRAAGALESTTLGQLLNRPR